MQSTVSRRGMLRGGSALGLLWSIGCGESRVEPDGGVPDVDAGPLETDAGPPPGRDAGAPPTGPFQHGVASGDPLPTSVILWTRVTVDGTAARLVRWEVAAGPAFDAPVASGEGVASEARDWTVKVDAGGLAPATTYYYRFLVDGVASPVGRTRTAPADDADVDRLRFAVCACASGGHGYFHAYRDIAARADLDLVVHLGDAIYEYGSYEYGQVRPYEPAHEIISLADYRTRHAWYRSDPDLRDAMRQHPWVMVWDDHETADNAWADGAEDHDPALDGPYAARKAAAQQAYDEWMPIRTADPSRIWRRLRFGRLADLTMFDTRLEGRTAQGEGDPAERMIMSAEQEAFIVDGLTSSTATWKLLGNQVIFAPVPALANVDQWDGYPAQRARILDALATGGEAGAPVSGVVVLTGDIHTSWAIEVPDPRPAGGAGPLAVEFVAPGITSPGLAPGPLEVGLRRTVMRDLPHVKFVDLVRRGFFVLDLDATRAQAQFFAVRDVTAPYDTTVEASETWEVRASSSSLTRATPAAPPRGRPALAP